MFSIGYMICNILQSQHGWGRHLTTIAPADFIEYRHISFFKSQLFVIGTNCVKVSIALLLMRVATLNKYKKFLWGTIGMFTLVTGVVDVLISIVQFS